MGTYWRGVLVALVLVCGVASAQSYVGVSAVGFSVVVVPIPIVLVYGHLGYEDLIAPAVDLRVNLGGVALFLGGGGLLGAALGADALWRFGGEEAGRWTPYAGAGVGVVAVGAGGGGSVDFLFGGTGGVIAGVDYHLEDMTIFGEFRGELWASVGSGVIEPGFIVLPGIRLGAKFPW